MAVGGIADLLHLVKKGCYSDNENARVGTDLKFGGG